MIDFTLSEDTKSIVSEFGCSHANVIEITFNDSYSKKTVHCIFKSKDLQKSFSEFERRTHNKVPTITDQHYGLLEETIYQNLDKLMEGQGHDDAINNGGGNSKQNGQKTNYLRKYETNDSLYEAVVLGGQPKFALYDKEKLQLLDEIKVSEYTFYPADNINTNNPIPYSFGSEQELEKYLQLAKGETLDSFFERVLAEYERYVCVDEHSLVTFAANTVCSYFQDKFGNTNYNILIGDNGSGKNSALLVYRMLGYRVFYVTAASPANYYTFLGDTQEGQGTIAEDEADNIGHDKDKQKILKTGYASGGNVPKVEFNKNGSRSQSSYLTYCHKWLTMEELPHEKNIRGIIDRSFIHKFLVGDVKYNIKNILKDKNSNQYKDLIHLRKLLIAFKVTKFSNGCQNINLNIKHRNRELTEHLLTLFRHGKNFDRIRLALSKLVNEKSTQKSNSIEAKIVEVLFSLMEGEDNYRGQAKEIYEFSNSEIFAKLTEALDGTEDLSDSNGSSIYLSDGTKLTKARVTSLLKSKFRAIPFRTNEKRGYRFSKPDIEKISKQYEVIEEIRIEDDAQTAAEELVSDPETTKNGDSSNQVTDVTDLTDFKGVCVNISEDKDVNRAAYPPINAIGNTDGKGPGNSYDYNNNDDGVSSNKVDDFHTDQTGTLKTNHNCDLIDKSKNNNTNNDFEPNPNVSVNRDRDIAHMFEQHPIDTASKENMDNKAKTETAAGDNNNNAYTPSERVTSVTSVTGLPNYHCLDKEEEEEEYIITLTKKKMLEG